MQTRNTKQKEAIREAFRAADRPLSPEETMLLAQETVEGLSIATVYRNINLLVEEQWLIPVEVPGDSARYEVAGKGHHHHFQCRRCSRLFELEGCALLINPKLPKGFRSTSHELFVYGICPSCG